MGDLGSIPGLRRSHGEGKGFSLQYSGLENSMACIVHGVAKNQTRLNDFHFHFHTDSWASHTVLVVKNLSGNARDIRDGGSIPGSVRSPV